MAVKPRGTIFTICITSEERLTYMCILRLRCRRLQLQEVAG